MTDTTDPQIQGQQQGSTDDILGGVDIFSGIPESTKPEEGLSYENMLGEDVQFQPIPETIEEILPTIPVQATAPVAAPVQQRPIPQAPVQATAPVAAPVQQRPIPQAPVAAPVQQRPIPQAPVQVTPPRETADHKVFIPRDEEISPSKPTPIPPEVKAETEPESIFQTDVQKKFGELVGITKKIYGLKGKLGTDEESFDILGADNDKLSISYRFLLDETDDPILFITKIEQDKETEEETVNELKFTFNTEIPSLEVIINDVLLFDEQEDFSQDQKKKLQVIDKINKFIFLASEEQRKMEKDIKEKEEEERERRKLQEIFRNF